MTIGTSSTSPDTCPSGGPDRVPRDAAATPACDCHFHVFVAHQSSPGARYRPAYEASVEDWSSLSHRSGIGRGVAVQPSFLGVDNRLLLQTLRHAPDVLRGVAVIAGDAKLVQLQRLREAGVRGIRLNLMGQANDADHLRALPSAWWSNVMAAGLHLELHADVGRIAALLPLVPEGLTVVLDHFGKPFAASVDDPTVTAVQQRTGRGEAVYITLSGVYRLGSGGASSASMQAAHHARELARLWLDLVGNKRLLWGSDWPCTNHEAHADYGRLRAQLDLLVADDANRPAILVDNPAALYWRE